VDHERWTVTVVEAARLLGISRSLAYDLVARDELPSIRLGRRVLVPLGALRAMVAGAVGHHGEDRGDNGEFRGDPGDSGAPEPAVGSSDV
jgi:excisionase family DNA binding protein